ncbi:MAG: hypothetical protein H7257_14225 [Taibaiella sp.]|nr:hypothetical protein [Taibaiella sp.]
MKLLCTLLAFMILILSVQPVCAGIAATDTCCDVAGGCDGPIEDGTTEHSKKECSNICNPFQVCPCCAFGIITPYQPAFILSAHFNMPSPQWRLFEATLPETPLAGLWQPPKIA